jgi:hypothetical protein
MNNECNLSTNELFTQLQNRLKLNLEENQVVCPNCKGLRLVLVESETKRYVESCHRCYNGALYVCKYCSDTYKSVCNCSEAQTERMFERESKQAEKEKVMFDKAEKINFKDYDGYFILDGYEEHVKDKDEVEEWIYDKLCDEKNNNYDADLPNYLWATKSKPAFHINLKEVVDSKCEDYEDMFDRLNVLHPLLNLAQIFVDQWEQEHNNILSVYEEDHSGAVIITDLIEKIKKEMG